MSDYNECDEPDGTCETCGLDLANDPDGDHDDHHRQCWRCWRGEPNEPDEPDPSSRFVAAFALLHEELAELRARLEALERRRAAA
jgi:hypothetical protein